VTASPDSFGPLPGPPPATLAELAPRVREALALLDTVANEACEAMAFDAASADAAGEWLRHLERAQGSLRRLLAGPAAARAELLDALGCILENELLGNAVTDAILAIGYASATVTYASWLPDGDAGASDQGLRAAVGAVLGGP
jgi:hypothetical protein